MGKMFDALNRMEREKTSDLRDDSPKAAPEDVVLDERLISFFQPASTAAEQFRRLRTYIIKTGDKSLRTILVTSAVAGEGKSLIALNLAITIATEFHNHALLVDCDLRSPSISRFIGLREKKGISDYLLGEAELSELLLKTPVEKLSVLSAGSSLQENPVELVGSKKMKSLIQDIRQRYDDRYIIIDSSPLLATTEPSVLNELVDGILLVVKAGETPRESVQQAIKLLKKNKILGIVLNKLEFKTQASIRRYFGTSRYYDDYQYANTPLESAKWRKQIGKLFLP